MLYQLHQRLCEITQFHDKLFGGVAVFFFGDLMQIPPTQGRQVFQKPMNPAFHDYYDNFDIWKSFSVLNLETNHRQGKYKRYGDLLNRMRVGKLNSEDIDLLRTRIRSSINHPDIPENALHVRCTNKEVNDINEQTFTERGSLRERD